MLTLYQPFESMKIGVRMNMGKTKVVCDSFEENKPIEIYNRNLEFLQKNLDLDEIKYSDKILDKTGDMNKIKMKRVRETKECRTSSYLRV